MATSRGRLQAMSTPELIIQAQDAIQALGDKPDVEAFNALLALSEALGEAIGESARLLAAHSSWSQVGEVSGTTKQAAWSRWSS
ncbi:MAG: hypothetical protein ABI720_01870 [Actinomycetes bacterium]